jgi:hypothetical protein
MAAGVASGAKTSPPLAGIGDAIVMLTLWTFAGGGDSSAAAPIKANSTGKLRIERILRKLDLENRAQAMLWVREHASALAH